MEKERRTKVLVLSTLVVVVATLSIAFAAMSRTLSINGIGKMDTASWSVYFDNLSNAKITRGAKEVGKPKISDDKGIVQDINVKLSNPKDEISYTVDIVNDGTIDAEITMIKDVELTEVQKKVFEFKVTYTDTGELLKDGDLLPKDTTKNITINIKFKDDITEFDLPTESQTINLSYQITYTQYDGDVPVGPDGGETTEKAVLAYNNTIIIPTVNLETNTFFNGTLSRNQVENLSFINNINVPSVALSTVWDASAEGDNSIIGWYEDIDSNGLYEVYIGSNKEIFAPEDIGYMFSMFVNMKQINFDNLNTSEVTNMTGLFWMHLISESQLESLDLSSFNTSNVTDMSYMFENCSSLTNLNLSSFDTKNVTYMSYMFYRCYSLTNLDISNFNTSNVTDMESMFANCGSLIGLDLRNADLSNVTSYGSMFSSVNESTQIIVKDETQRTWITSKFTSLTNVVLPSEL